MKSIINLKYRETKFKINRLLFISVILLFISTAGVNALIIGGRENGYFNGAIDEVRIYNRVLSEEEVIQHYYSNLYKYDVDRWSFYTNQIKLAEGVYTYQGFAKDMMGNKNQTEMRVIAINSFIPVNSSCATYYGFDYSSGRWINYYNSSDTVLKITQCPDELCVVYSDVNTTCDGGGGIIHRNCSDSIASNKPQNEVCGLSVGYKCNGTEAGSDLIKQENVSQCDGAGKCIENKVVGNWSLEINCEWPNYCYYDGVDAICECKDRDNDNVCDLEEPECVDQNSLNLPPDTPCKDWEFNSTSGCWYFIYNDACTGDPDGSKVVCAANFSKGIDEVICRSFGDYNCWDDNIAEPVPSNDTACCGDDVNIEDRQDECWVDDTNNSGCCWSNKYNKVVYITEPDDSGVFCNLVGEKKFGFNSGICDETGEEYCFATALPDISQDPGCCCCGDDENETWSLFTSGGLLKDVIVSGKCQDGKWVEREAITSTLYDIWTRITS